MTPAEIITATGGALSATLMAVAALVKALRRKCLQIDVRVDSKEWLAVERRAAE